MTDFKAKMHQIRFRLGLRPRPRWGSLQRSSRPPSWIWGSLLLRRGERRGREERGRKERREGRGGEEREGEGKGRKGPWAPPLFGGSLRLWCPPTSKSWLRHWKMLPDRTRPDVTAWSCQISWKSALRGMIKNHWKQKCLRTCKTIITEELTLL